MRQEGKRIEGVGEGWNGEEERSAMAGEGRRRGNMSGGKERGKGMRGDRRQ